MQAGVMDRNELGRLGRAPGAADRAVPLRVAGRRGLLRGARLRDPARLHGEPVRAPPPLRRHPLDDEPGAHDAGLGDLDRRVVLAAVPPFRFEPRGRTPEELEILELAQRRVTLRRLAWATGGLAFPRLRAAYALIASGVLARRTRGRGAAARGPDRDRASSCSRRCSASPTPRARRDPPRGPGRARALGAPRPRGLAQGHAHGAPRGAHPRARGQDGALPRAPRRRRRGRRAQDRHRGHPRPRRPRCFASRARPPRRRSPRRCSPARRRGRGRRPADATSRRGLAQPPESRSVPTHRRPRRPRRAASPPPPPQPASPPPGRRTSCSPTAHRCARAASPPAARPPPPARPTTRGTAPPGASNFEGRAQIEHLLMEAEVRMTVSDYANAVKVYEKLVELAPKVGAFRAAARHRHGLLPPHLEARGAPVLGGVAARSRQRRHPLPVRPLLQGHEVSAAGGGRDGDGGAANPRHKAARAGARGLSPKDSALTSLKKLFS